MDDAQTQPLAGTRVRPDHIRVNAFLPRPIATTVILTTCSK
jgi:hypothetical protein